MAKVQRNAKGRGTAKVQRNAKVQGIAKVQGNAIVQGARTSYPFENHLPARVTSNGPSSFTNLSVLID